MKKRVIAVALILAVAFGGIFGWKAFANYKMHEFMAARGIPPVTVSTAPVKRVAWRNHIRSVGSLAAIEGVTVTAQLPGIVTAIDFHSGAPVRAGALLVQVNDQPQLAELAYDQAQARLALANLRRARILYKENATSRAQLDSAIAAYHGAAAHVAGDWAAIHELALRAPFSGILGIRQVNLGQYLAPGAPIVDLQSYRTLYANFTLPQVEVPRVHVGQAVELRVDAFPHHPFVGHVHAIDATVNPVTRNILVQAIVPNPTAALRPGMFGRVRLIGQHAHKVLAIPAAALTYNTYGDTVFVVRHGVIAGHPHLIAHQVVVAVGRERHGYVAITSGLKAGQTVVTAGQVKLRNGMPIAINNTVQP
ncbi:efflux RND transporter periplasmic adaptor subunit [Acidiferrobacter sp.]|uniref:efflux RND transporter periplasmic adaptor subunit n=1 Tax=Acidiferrobacter sp. TaxID=1872107 RepID=UPI002633329F|nr:efflux RND transporter periplasmic adaptor subunit [Acidiferrobacter sp.]